MCTNIRHCPSTAAAEVPYDRAMDSLIEPSSLAGLEPDSIAISNVNLSLGAGAARVHILKDISLRVASGEAIGLIGPSGSGKSTLLMVMAGLERPDSGEVVVNGTPFNALDEDALARFRGRQVGIVFQSFHLIPTMTALENVAVPLELAGNPDAARRAAQELTSVGLGDRLHHYPTQLSGGEQQRVALARALAPDPAILVADEPTGNLDEATGKQIVDLLVHQARRARHDAGAGDPRHLAGATLRPRGAAALGPDRWPVGGSHKPLHDARRRTHPRQPRALRLRCALRCANCAAACAAFTFSSPASRSA